MNAAPGESDRTAGKIRGLILDYGEVLCNHAAPDKIAQLAAGAGLDPETFTLRYGRDRDPYDRGDLSPADYWKSVVSDRVVLGDKLLDALRQWDVEMWSDVNRDLTEWLHQARAAGLKTAVLSNMHPDMAVHARRSFDWLQDLDCVILSCEVRLIKPDRAIYDLCLAGLELPPFETCFIDDREVNVQAARDAGLTALRFHTVESLRNDLTGVGVPVLPRARSRQPASGAGNRAE